MNVRPNWQPLDLANVPDESGVYAFKVGDRWLYIGKANNLKQQLNQQEHIPLQQALELFPDVTLIYCLSKFHHGLEQRLLKKFKPEWNQKQNKSCWRALDLTSIPTQSGVYGFKVGRRWLYIGKADNLKQRLTQRHIPLQITLECFASAKLYYILSESPLRLEKRLHEQLKPEWNGRTARIGGKYPVCEIPIQNLDYLDKYLDAAVSTLKF